MQVRIVEKHFGGVEFCPEMKMLHLGGQSSANVERLEFILPESWQGKSVTLHIQRQDGTLPTPILLDEEDSCAVGKEFTASPCGQWMLLALGEDGFRALTRPAKYDCYETLATDGDAEISQTQYEAFVAQVLDYSNAAQNSAKEARNAAAAAKQDANKAEAARTEATTAASEAGAAQSAAEGSASRAERAADRAELTAPSDGAVRSVNGKGGVVTLTAADLGAVEENSAGYVKSITITGQTVTLTMGDGSTRTLQTKDTTTLENLTGILDTAHGGTGKNTALTAEDVGAYSKEESYGKTEVYSKTEADGKFGAPYTLPTATETRLGGVKAGSGLSVEADGTLNAEAYTKKESDAAQEALQKKMQKQISAASAITASGKGYIRFSDGTQICWNTAKLTDRSTYYVFAFPVPFIDTTYAVAGMKTASISDTDYNNFYVNKKTTDRVEIKGAYNQYNNNPYSTLIVIGRWK
nr:MAG TPA: putative tail fiber protein [Caudoviricetes sp.]